MAKNSVSEWDETAGNNTDVAGVNIDEGCAPSGMNNAVRAVMAQIKAFFKSSAFRLRDGTDQTKLLALDLSGITTATTRTLTVQDKNGTVALTSDIIVQRGHIFGLALANNVTDAVNDIDIAVGEAASSATTPALITLAAALTKRLDAAWAVGNNQGGLDTGTVSNGTYHLYLIRRPDTGVVDACFSLDASSPNTSSFIPSAYTQYRRIGAVMRSGGAIRAFKQYGDDFLLNAPATDVNVTNPGTAAVTRTLTVPAGVEVRALLTAFITDAATSNTMYLSPLSLSDATAAVGGAFQLSTATGARSVAPVSVWTNTASQIRSRVENSSASTQILLTTLGWMDRRGA